MSSNALRLAAFDSFLLFGTILFSWSFWEMILGVGSSFALPSGFLLWGTVKFWQIRSFRLSASDAAMGFAFSVMLALFAFIMGTWLWDSSFDGRAYHQEAILRLASDYHPYRAALENGGAMGLWVEHYPKALEIVAAALLDKTGSTEMGKGFGIWFLLSNLFLLYDAAPSLCPALGNKRVFRAVLALAVAANPVVLSQLPTYYVDGLMYSLLVALVLVARPMLSKEGWKFYPISFAIVLASLNLKFTSVVYTCMAIGGLCLYRWLKMRRITDHFHLHFGLAVMVGILWVGYNPYVTNTMGNGHVFYPLYGEGRVDIMTGNSPVGFPDLGRFAKFATAFFGRTENVVPSGEGGGLVHPKIPGMVYPKELTALFAPDCRVGGFGPLASLYMLLSMLFLYNWLKSWQWDALHGLWLLALASSLLNPEFWWARYVPQLWLVPFLMLCVALPRNKIYLVFRNIALAVLLINVGLVAAFSLGGAVAKSLWMRHQIAALRGVSSERALVSIDFLTADRAKLVGVPFQIVPAGSLDSLAGDCPDFMEYSKVCFHDPVLAERFANQAKLTDFIKSRLK